MDSIILRNEINNPFTAEVIRYFTLNNSKYLLFTQNEKDNASYIKLYGVKIDIENGNIIAKNIQEDSEWQTVKHQIQVIVSNNRNSIPNTNDLDYHELNDIQITSSRAFKLSEISVSELSKNKQNVKAMPLETQNTTTLTDAQFSNTSVQDYKTLYENIQKENTILKAENAYYKQIIDNIKKQLPNG